jgi:hypothetical protein
VPANNQETRVLRTDILLKIREADAPIS